MSKPTRLPLIAFLSVLLLACGQTGTAATKTSMPTKTPTPIKTATATRTVVPTGTPWPTPTATPSPTLTPTGTPGAASTPTSTSTPRPTNTSVALPQGRITADLNLRAGPGTQYGRIGSMAKDTIVTIWFVSGDGKWYSLELPGGKFGWASAEYVSILPGGVAIPTIAAANIPPTPTSPPPTNTPRPTHTPVPAATPAPTPTTAPQPTNTSQPAAVCNCSGDLYNCDDFSGHAAAQACYNYCISLGRGDIHRLDRDKDGIACE